MSVKLVLGQVIALCVLSSAAAGLSYWWLDARKLPVFTVQGADEKTIEIEGQISIKEIVSKWGINRVVWIDARPLRFYQSGHIPGALHLETRNDIQYLDPAVAQVVMDPERPKVIYCGLEDCKNSVKLMNALKEVNFENLHVLQGGYSRWKREYPDKIER